MKRKTVVLLSSVLAGALLVGGTFAAFAVTDLASPKGVDFTPGTQEEVDYVTLDWGDHTDLKSVDEIQLNTFYKSGVLGLYSSKAYDGLLKITIADATPLAVQKDPSDPKLIDYFDVYVYEGKDADPQSAELLGKIDNPQDETQTELKLYLGGTTQGHDVTVYVRIDSALGEEGFAKVHNDVVHLEADWSKNDQSGDYDYTDRTIYVEKPAGWESINAYSWEGDKEGPAWPGKAMNVELPTGLYKTTVPAQDTNLIFNDGENKLPAPTELDPDPSYTYAGYDQNKGYIFWDGDAWQMLPVQTVDSKFSLEINDQEVPAATLAGYVVTDAIVNQGNNIVYDIPVAANDKLEFAYDGDLIYFGGTNDLGQDTLIDTEHTFEEAGTYRFYINRYNHIFYEAKGQPVLSDYYLIGTFNDWKIDDTNYQLSVNQQQEGEYMGVFTLNAGDGVKVYGSEVYYPEGEGNEYVVQASGEHTIYFRPAGNPEWADNYFYVVEPAAPVVGYSATLNGQALDLSDKTATYDPQKDNAAYQLELAKTDVLVFKYGEDVLDFCHWDEEQKKVVIDSQAYTPEEAGTYKFVINKSNEIFVEQEETPVADNIVYGSKAGAAWGKIADLVAHKEGEVKALNVELAVGDKFIFHLEGDNYMKYANLKTEGTGSAHDHFTTDTDGNLVVVTAGTFDFYVLEEGEKTIWSALSSGEDPEPQPQPSEKSYYLVGSFNNWEGQDEDYILVANQDAAGEYFIKGVALAKGAQLKVVDSANAWYPDGMGNEYVVADAGNYDIYFRPDGKGNDDWHEGYFYVAAAAQQA